jgi:hypothetical protein
LWRAPRGFSRYTDCVSLVHNIRRKRGKEESNLHSFSAKNWTTLNEHCSFVDNIDIIIRFHSKVQIGTSIISVISSGMFYQNPDLFSFTGRCIGVLFRDLTFCYQMCSVR